MSAPTPFVIKDCNLSIIATGIVAESLIELRDHLYEIPLSSIYYHFWGGRLRISFAHPEYHNDFARFAHFGLNDEILTERLAIVDPTEYENLEDLRKKVIDIIEERIEEINIVIWSKNEYKFNFLRSIIITYDSKTKIESPPDLKTLIPKLTPSSIFYHFIDSRRRTQEKKDDFSYWLSQFENKNEELINKIKEIDPYFLSISEIKQKLNELFNRYL